MAIGICARDRQARKVFTAPLWKKMWKDSPKIARESQLFLLPTIVAF